MDREAQQRIMGFFIEESRDHLVNLEQGLLSLQERSTDEDFINDLFRAAHSIKGGAGMLGIHSIQRTAHRIEDVFKIFRERTVPVDKPLEELLLRCHDTLATLFDRLQSPEGLSEAEGEAALTQIEPTFQQLDHHIKVLLGEGTPSPGDAISPPAPSLQDVFGQYVSRLVRELSSLLDQTDSIETRARMRELGETLCQVGATNNVPEWQALAQCVSAGLNNPAASFEELRNISVPELEQAQQSVLAGQAETIVPSEPLRELEVRGLISEQVEVGGSPANAGELPDLFTELGQPEVEIANLVDQLAEPEHAPSQAPEIFASDADDDLADLLDASGDESASPVSAELSLDDVAPNYVEANNDSLDALLSSDTQDNNLDDLLSGLSGSSAVEDDLDNLLDDLASSETSPQTAAAASDTFAGLDDMLSSPTSSIPTSASSDIDELSKLLDNSSVGPAQPPTPPASLPTTPQPAIPRRSPTPAPSSAINQTMRVEVRYLDTINNMVGELVVGRNSLEQNQGRLSQFLENLLFRVRQLSEVGQKMQDRYERSLLEASLGVMRGNTASPPAGGGNNASDSNNEFDALEMDRFTAFHTLSQEIIELIVRIREASSDIQFVVDKSDLVTRQFRQVISQLQENLNQARMKPFAELSDRLPRAVRKLSMQSGKQIKLDVEGQETLIDKAILEDLYDPMTHLINNAIVHGVEPPEDRVAQSKSPEGRIDVRTFYQGNQIIIVVSDDGKGIDAGRVKEKAIAQGLVSANDADSLSLEDIYDFIFHPGLSTRSQADELAGRGVGMDVVRTSLNELRGSIQVDSTPNVGTTFTIRLPLTLSVSKAMICLSDKAHIAFPLDGVEEMIDVSSDQLLHAPDGSTTLQWRDMQLPCQPLSSLLNYNCPRGHIRTDSYNSQDDSDVVPLIILNSNGRRVALQVESFEEEQEIVIKQLGGPAAKPLGIAGATVLGDGRVLPIADILELIDLSQGRIRRDPNRFWVPEHIEVETDDNQPHQPTVLIVDDSITVRELLSMTFSKVGYRVEQARDGQDAWDKLRGGLPCDLVFCDIEMPRMDGLELLSRLQGDDELSKLPVAMLTSRGADRHRQMAASLGASAYFTKPYLEEELLSAAGRLLQGEALMGAV